MLKLCFVFLIANGVRAMEENQENQEDQQEQNHQATLFGTGYSETCLSCYDDFDKSVANQHMVAVRHNQPNMLCTHYIYCGACYKEFTDQIEKTLKKDLIGDRVRSCPKDRQSGDLVLPEQNGVGINENLLNHAINQQSQKYDSLTQHLIINSTILVITMTMWIALEEHGQLRHTWAKLGYVLQQLVRTYFGYVFVAGWVYSFADRPVFKWKNAEYPWRLKPSYIALYLFTITSSVLMLHRQVLHATGEAGEMSPNVAFWTNLASWFSMIGGLLIGIYSQIFQKKFNFQHKRFANFQLSQPQEKLCGTPVETQTFAGYLMGVLFTIVPFFSLFQGITILHRLQVSADVYSSFWHSDFLFGAELATWCGVVGIVFGLVFALVAQIIRVVEGIGMFTLDNLMLTGISFFLSFHSDPTAGIILLFIEVVIAILVMILACRGA